MPSKKTLTLLIAILIAVCGFLATAAPAFAASKEKVLYSFAGESDGGYAASPLIFNANGNLYGTTAQGGANGYGTVFELTPGNGTWTETVLYSFCSLSGCADGAAPYSGLVFDSEGNLYGTTQNGGSGCGTVFQLIPTAGAWTESVLHTFAGADGCNPYAGLIFDENANLYGTTQGGGAYNRGIVFELASETRTEAVLHSFHAPNSHDGLAPFGALVFDGNGNLYGTTYGGGDAGCSGGGGCGTVFELASDGQGSWTESVLHRFKGTGGNGSRPRGNLIFDSAGNLYGTTTSSHDGYGVVFKLTPNGKGGWTQSVLHNFNSLKKGVTPMSGLVADTQGNLYGTTVEGGSFNEDCTGSGCGVVFKLSLASGKWAETVLFSFDDADGALPWSSLILDGSGNLYGTTIFGGTGSCTSGNGSGCGTAFEITP